MMSQDFRTAERTFYNWATKWAQLGINNETPPVPDVLEIITILQAIGYKVKFIDPNVNTEDTLVSGAGGIRMTIQCTHSGLRACLELPSDCQCPKMNNTSFWEVTGSAPNTSQEVVQESGSDMLLPISKGTQYVISKVINHLFNMIKSDQNQNDNYASSKYTEINTQVMETNGLPSVLNNSFRSCYSGFNQDSNTAIEENLENLAIAGETCVEVFTTETDNVKIEVVDTANLVNKQIDNAHSPQGSMSPARYRSLDTLTSGATRKDGLPEPGLLRKDSIDRESYVNMMHSSPDITGKSRPSSTSSPNYNVKHDYMVFMKVKMAQDILEEVVQLMTSETKEYFEDISKIKESYESLSSLGSKCSPKATISKIQKLSKNASSPNLTKTSVFSKIKTQKFGLLKPQARPPIRSNSTNSVTLQARPKIRTASNSEEQRPESAKKKPSIKDTTLKSLPPIKNLYSNVKSTIPKANIKKPEVKK